MTWLRDVRVLDLTLGPVRIGPRVLADLGADVTRIAAGEHGLAAGWYDLGKRVLQGRAGCGACTSHVRALAVSADVVALDPNHDWVADLGGSDTLRASTPRPIWAMVTPFGSSGPKAAWQGSELIAQAAGGLMARTPDLPESPVMVGAPAAFTGAGLQLGFAIMLALRTRRITGEARAIDLSIQQATADLTYSHVMTAFFAESGGAAERTTKRRVWPCREGYVNWVWWTGPGWGSLNRPLIAWMQEHGLGEGLDEVPWETMKPFDITPEMITHWEDAFADFFARFTKAELYDGSVQRRIQLYPVSAPSDVLVDTQLDARQVFRPYPSNGRLLTAPSTWGWRAGQPIGTRPGPPAEPPQGPFGDALAAFESHLAGHR